MSVLIISLILSMSLVVNSVIYNITVFCPANATVPCGAGGTYSMKQVAPTVGPILEDPDFYCSLGDVINFYFPVILPTHPFSIYTNLGALFPGVATQAYVGVGTVTFNCDFNLQNAGPANYLCDVHPSMAGKIFLGTGSPTVATIAPTSPPTPAPSRAPTPAPTAATPAPTAATPAPTAATPAPTAATNAPTVATGSPTAATPPPTFAPTPAPTAATNAPTTATAGPTPPPTFAPTTAPIASGAPTPPPTFAPTLAPTVSGAPSLLPTPFPTAAPIAGTSAPTIMTSAPTFSPTSGTTQSPTASTTPAPTEMGTQAPSLSPTPSPTSTGSQAPTSTGTSAPTSTGSQAPTSTGSQAPTQMPTSGSPSGTTWSLKVIGDDFNLNKPNWTRNSGFTGIIIISTSNARTNADGTALDFFITMAGTLDSYSQTFVCDAVKEILNNRYDKVTENTFQFSCIFTFSNKRMEQAPITQAQVTLSSPTSNNEIWIIIGACVGGLILIIILAAILFLILKKDSGSMERV